MAEQVAGGEGLEGGIPNGQVAPGRNAPVAPAEPLRPSPPDARSAEQVDLQAWSDFLAESQLDPERKRHLNAPDVRFARAAYEAGAASRQGEVDKLNAVIDRALDYIKSLEGLLP